MAIACATLVLLVSIIAVLAALGKDTATLTSLVVTAVIPTITSLVALDTAGRTRQQLRTLTNNSDAPVESD